MDSIDQASDLGGEIGLPDTSLRLARALVYPR